MTSDQATVIPGEILYGQGDIEINAGAVRVTVEVVNTGDRPIQVGSHVHFPQANAALQFDRHAAHAHRLDVPAGTAIRFEPGVKQQVSLVPLQGAREVHGLTLTPPGRLDVR